MLCVFLLSSCTSVDREFRTHDSLQKSLQKLIGTNVQLISIQSNNVKAAGYHDFTDVMTVQFKSGATYEYYAVALELWEDFLQAQPDPWSKIGYPRLVQGNFVYEEIK